MIIKSIILEEYNAIVESPDNVLLPSGQKIRCEQNDAYPFIVDAENPENVFVGNAAHYHSSFESDIRNMGISIGYKGRIWLNNKIITFWDYPYDFNELKTILEGLENALLYEQNVEVDILNDPEFTVEVYEENKDEYGDRVMKSKLIPLKQFRGEKYVAPQGDHLLKQDEKERLRKAGLRKAYNTLYHNKRMAAGTKSDSAAEYKFIRDRGIAENEEDYRGEHHAPNKDDSPMYDVTNEYGEDIYDNIEKAVRYFGAYRPYDSYSIGLIQSARNKPNMRVKIYRAVPAVLTNQEKINDYEKQKKYILKTGRLPQGVDNWKDKSEYYDYISNEIEKLKTLPAEQESKTQINSGDWVTINPAYAKEHGKSNLNNKYRILSKTVFAKNLFTDGNDIHEWGYVNY